MRAEKDPRALKPRNIAVCGRELALAWADGHESYYPFDQLRRDCPCALCRDQSRKEPSRDPLRVVSGPSLKELSISRLLPVGAYAVQIVWSDGHDTGIYTFESLRHDCPCEACSAAR